MRGSTVTTFPIAINGLAFSWEDIHAIFRCTPNLASCFLKDVRLRSTTGFPDLGGPVVLRHLKRLCLRVYLEIIDPFPGHLHRVLVAPALETLAIYHAENFNITSYTHFINQSSCNLNEIYLAIGRMTPADFLECMRLSPTLKILHLQSIQAIADEGVCQALMEWTEASRCFTLIPHLQILSMPRNPLTGYDDLHAPNFDFNILADVLRKRLCPPDDSHNASFTTLAFPSIRGLGEPSVFGLQGLMRYPWNLQVASNDGCFKFYIDRLCKVYVGQ